MDRNCIPSFLKKDDLGIVKNYRGITLTFIAPKMYNALLLNHIEPEIEKILKNNQYVFFEKPMYIINSYNPSNHKVSRTKSLETTLVFVYFSKSSDSMKEKNMEQMLQVHGLPKETAIAM